MRATGGVRHAEPGDHNSLIRSYEKGNEEDDGADVVVRGVAGDHVYEIKSFSRRLSTSQKRQVLKSLRTAVRQQSDMVAWTLVLPLDPTPSEERWLREELAAETRLW